MSSVSKLQRPRILARGNRYRRSLHTPMFNAIADYGPDLTPVAAPERLRASLINGIKHCQVNYGTG
jgi:hypothetical protein